MTGVPMTSNETRKGISGNGMKRAFQVAILLTVALLCFAAYQALVVAPTEQTMGDVQRIFYYHVPSAWTAFLLFLINFI